MPSAQRFRQMDREQALQAALDQINVAFGKEEALTPEQRRKRAERRLDELEVVREGLLPRAEEDAAMEPDERGWSHIDPVTAYILAWYLRREADSDHALSIGEAYSDALEEAADQIESGVLLACPQEMLTDVDEAIAELRAVIAAP